MEHKILLVDDEKNLLKEYKSLLKDKLYADVDVATNGLDAFLMCLEKEYQLIITDFKMPFMTGAALAIAIRTKTNKNTNVPIILLSGFIDNELKKSIPVSSIDFLEKPISAHDFISFIRNKIM